jgi:hypothetical protein
VPVKPVPNPANGQDFAVVTWWNLHFRSFRGAIRNPHRWSFWSACCTVAQIHDEVSNSTTLELLSAIL